MNPSPLNAIVDRRSLQSESVVFSREKQNSDMRIAPVACLTNADNPSARFRLYLLPPVPSTGRLTFVLPKDCRNFHASPPQTVIHY